jgi:hypothetical protein
MCLKSGVTSDLLPRKTLNQGDPNSIWCQLQWVVVYKGIMYCLNKGMCWGTVVVSLVCKGVSWADQVPRRLRIACKRGIVYAGRIDGRHQKGLPKRGLQ